LNFGTQNWVKVALISLISLTVSAIIKSAFKS